MLNAFRHHRGRHRTNPCDLRGLPRVLNAFRHHRGRHMPPPFGTGRCWKCSTPFGITEVGTPRDRPTLVSARQCSTPFGITEVGTLIMPMKSRTWNRAQRLSASQRSARQQGACRRREARVLNAFRHHRGRHTCDGLENPGGRLVLNAFRHHRGRHEATSIRYPCGCMCSTPFGITEVGTARARKPS